LNDAETTTNISKWYKNYKQRNARLLQRITICARIQVKIYNTMRYGK